jgi:hypothetical protein
MEQFMGQENIKNSKKNTESTTMQMARKLGILEDLEDTNSNKDDLSRLELIVNSSSKKESKKNLKKSKATLSKDDIPLIKELLLKDENRDILEQIAKEIEPPKQKTTNNLKVNLKEIFNTDTTLKQEATATAEPKVATKLEPELVELFSKEETLSIKDINTPIQEEKPKVEPLNTTKMKLENMLKEESAKLEPELAELFGTKENSSELLTIKDIDTSSQKAKVDTSVSSTEIKKQEPPVTIEPKVATVEVKENTKIEPELAELFGSDQDSSVDINEPAQKITIKEESSIDKKQETTTQKLKDSILKLEEEPTNNIKIDKFCIIDKDSKESNQVVEVTPEDIDRYLAKQDTYKKEQSTKLIEENKLEPKSKKRAKKVSKQKFVYNDFSAVSTWLKAIFYPLLTFLPISLVAWLSGKLNFKSDYLNMLEPYKNSTLNFLQSNSIGLKTISTIGLVIGAILALVFLISFIKRLFGHFKNARVATNKEYSYVPSKKSIFITYLKSFLIIAIALAIFTAASYWLYDFFKDSINFSGLNTQDTIAKVMAFFKSVIATYAK